MSHFQPSYASLGAGEPTSTPAASTDYNQLLAQYGPTIAALLAGGKDPRERAALLQARIENYLKLRTTPPFSVIPGKGWYDAEIAKMRAILPTVQAQAGEATAVAQAKLNVAGLTQGALIGLIGVAAATTLLLLTFTWRTAQRPA